MQGIFDEWFVFYEIYSLLTTRHQETNYVLHAQQQIWMLSFSGRSPSHLKVPQMNNLKKINIT